MVMLFSKTDTDGIPGLRVRCVLCGLPLVPFVDLARFESYIGRMVDQPLWESRYSFRHRHPSRIERIISRAQRAAPILAEKCDQHKMVVAPRGIEFAHFHDVQQRFDAGLDSRLLEKLPKRRIVQRLACVHRPPWIPPGMSLRFVLSFHKDDIAATKSHGDHTNAWQGRRGCHRF